MRAAVSLLALFLIGASEPPQRFYMRTVIPPLSTNGNSTQPPVTPPSSEEPEAPHQDDKSHEEFPEAPPEPAPSPVQAPSQLQNDAWRIINAGRLMSEAASRYAHANGRLPAEPGHLIPTYVSALPAISDIGDIKGNSHGHPHRLADATFTIYRLHENLCVMVNVALGNGALLHVPEDSRSEGCDNGVYFRKHPIR